MSITLKEMKTYLRVDGNEDNTLIRSLIGSAERLCMDVIRTDDVKILYGSMRSMLFGSRQEAF